MNRINGVLRLVLLFLLALCSLPLSAQDRSRMAVFVPMPTGGTAEQRAYFQDNFMMELIGANYPNATSKSASAYTLVLNINDNPDFDSSLAADDDNPRYMLDVKLERSADNTEIIAFGFPFNDTKTMADWNLFLLYQALANAYLPEDKNAAPSEAGSIAASASMSDDRWRNKWLYLNTGVGIDLGFLLPVGLPKVGTGFLMPMAFVGAEYQVLNFLSIEIDPVKVRLLGNGERYFISTATPLLLKGILKPEYPLMVEPYGGMEFAYTFETGALWLSGLVGIQVGFRSTTQSAVTADIGMTIGMLGSIEGADGYDYNMLRLSIVAGYKIGWFDRKK